MTLHVINGLSDTLVIIRELTTNDLQSNTITYPLEDTYSPNFLFFKSSGLTMFEADGRFKVHYDSISPLLAILPYGQVNLQVDISSLKDLIIKSEWHMYAFVMLATKRDLDSLVAARISCKIAEYKASYSNDSTMILKKINLNNGRNENKFDKNDIDIIQNAFTIRLGS